jgi:hypothetical protein
MTLVEAFLARTAAIVQSPRQTPASSRPLAGAFRLDVKT